MCAYYDSLQIPAHAISRSVVWSLEIVMFYYSIQVSRGPRIELSLTMGCCSVLA